MKSITKQLQSKKLEKTANDLLRTPKQIKNLQNYKRLNRRNSKFINILRKKATKEEVIVGKWLLQQNIYFIFQKGFFNPFHRIVDFYLPRRGIVEVDGGYHNDIKDKDDNKDYLWNKYRYMRTLRITNEQVLDGSFTTVLQDFIGIKKYPRDKSHKSKYPEEWNK